MYLERRAAWTAWVQLSEVERSELPGEYRQPHRDSELASGLTEVYIRHADVSVICLPENLHAHVYQHPSRFNHTAQPRDTG